MNIQAANMMMRVVGGCNAELAGTNNNPHVLVLGIIHQQRDSGAFTDRIRRRRRHVDPYSAIARITRESYIGSVKPARRPYALHGAG